MSKKHGWASVITAGHELSALFLSSPLHPIIKYAVSRERKKMPQTNVVTTCLSCNPTSHPHTGTLTLIDQQMAHNFLR